LPLQKNAALVIHRAAEDRFDPVFVGLTLAPRQPSAIFLGLHKVSRPASQPYKVRIT
jgi:hypothetical protein